MFAAAQITPVVASISITELLIQKKFLQSYLELVTVLLKTFENDQAIFELNSKILRFTQRTGTIPMQYADKLYAK